MSGERLSQRFFATDAATLAQRLIGKRLVRVLPDGARLSGVVVETEAYLGVHDKAAHSAGGRRTPRTEPMFDRAGTSYVFLTYGMHHCLNIVCGKVGEPTAVLVRALEPEQGVERMRALRSARPRKHPVPDRALTSGPARLSEALDIDRGLNHTDLTTNAELFLEHAPTARQRGWTLAVGPRIGIDYAQEWKHAPLRWWVKDHRHVSR